MFAFMRHTKDKRQEQYSAYLDGVLSPGDRAKVEALLATSADARRDLESLRATVALLRAAPRAAAPRSFALTPAMLRQPASSSLTRPGPWLGPRLLLPLASATALAFLTFTLVGGSLSLFTRDSASTAQPEAATAFQETTNQRSAAPAATSLPLPTASPEAMPPIAGFAPPVSGPSGAPGLQTDAYTSAAAPLPDVSLKALEAIPPQATTKRFPWLALQIVAAALTAATAIALLRGWRKGAPTP